MFYTVLFHMKILLQRIYRKKDVFYLWVLVLRFMIFRRSLKMSVLAYHFLF